MFEKETGLTDEELGELDEALITKLHYAINNPAPWEEFSTYERITELEGQLFSGKIDAETFTVEKAECEEKLTREGLIIVESAYEFERMLTFLKALNFQSQEEAYETLRHEVAHASVMSELGLKPRYGLLVTEAQTGDGIQLSGCFVFNTVDWPSQEAFEKAVKAPGKEMSPTDKKQVGDV